MVLRDHLKAAAHWLSAPAGSQRLEVKASEAAQAAVRYQVGIPQYPPRAYRELFKAYRTNPIIRRATKLCAEAVASIEPVIKVGGAEDHPVALKVAEVLRLANPKQDRFGFIRDLAGFEKLSGNGWVEIVPGISRDYLEQYALRPERMQIVPGANGWPQAYIYDPGTGQKKQWQADGKSALSRILHIKDFSTDDDHFGAGALEAAQNGLAIYEDALRLARALLENGAVMSGALVYSPKVPAGATPPQLTKEQRDGLQERLAEWTSGRKKAGKPMVLDQSLEWVPMSTNLVDLQAEEIRKQAARDIANAFGVPPMLLGIPGDNTYANFSEASRAFYRNTVIPDASRIFGALGRQYAALLGIEGLTLEVDEEKMWALADEVAMSWSRIDNAQGLTLNERREAKGYDELPDESANIVLVSGGFTTLDAIVNPLGPNSMLPPLEGPEARLLPDDSGKKK